MGGGFSMHMEKKQFESRQRLIDEATQLRDLASPGKYPVLGSLEVRSAALQFALSREDQKVYKSMKGFPRGRSVLEAAKGMVAIMSENAVQTQDFGDVVEGFDISALSA